MEEHEGVERPGLVLGPDEIINYPLRKATRGYAVREVDDLLDQLAVQTQDLLGRLSELEDERDTLRREVSEAGEAESMLKRTLVTAQRAAEASVAEAREEAEALRLRARARAEELLASAVEQAQELREAALRRARADEADMRRYRRDVEEHIDTLRTFAADHRARLAHHLELQQQRLDEMDLPDAPPPPDLPEDEILDAEVAHVDVRGMVEELAGPAEPDDLDGGEPSRVGEPSSVDGSPSVDEPSSVDEPQSDDDAGDDGGDDASDADDADGTVDTAERLFEE